MYERINWVNGLSGGTPINATNLNKGDLALSELMNGWISIPGTLTYSSADAPKFVASTSVDLTGVISVGMKLKLTQTTVKYFIVTAITNSTITLYGGTDYTLANAVITLPYYSTVTSPFGFPTDDSKWNKIYLTMDVTNGNTYTSKYLIGAKYVVVDWANDTYSIQTFHIKDGYSLNTYSGLSAGSIYNSAAGTIKYQFSSDTAFHIKSILIFR